MLLLSCNSTSRRSSYYGDYGHYGPRYHRRWPGYGAGGSSWFGSNNSWSSGWTSGSSYRSSPSPPSTRTTSGETSALTYNVIQGWQESKRYSKWFLALSSVKPSGWGFVIRGCRPQTEVISLGNHRPIMLHIGYVPKPSQRSQCQKLAFTLLKVSVSDNWPNIICQVLLSIRIKEQFVISDNAHSLHREDYLAYDLCPSCLMLVQPQELLVPMKNKDILIFRIT